MSNLLKITSNDQLRTEQQQSGVDSNQLSTDINKQVVATTDPGQHFMNPSIHTMNPSNVLNVPTQISGKIAEFISAVNPEGAPFINPTDNISQTNALEAKEFIQQQLKKPLGPDHINTLEQLKIELENITHVHMMTKFLAENEGNATVQLSPDMAMGQQYMEGKFEVEKKCMECVYFD